MAHPREIRSLQTRWAKVTEFKVPAAPRFYVADSLACPTEAGVEPLGMMLASKQPITPSMPTKTEPPQVQPAAQLRVLFGRISRRLRQTQAGAGLTPTQLSVLATVVRHGPLGLAQLSQREGINPTMLSRIVAKLGGQGLVTRRSDPLDGRAAVLLATAKGGRLQRRIQLERNDSLGQRFEQLPESQRQLLLNAMPAMEALADSLLASDP